jgi:formylglycine-generating enzyme required for sulfatase activity
VSDFRLDVFEVTVGRFRTYLADLAHGRPKPGDGALPKVAGSGWSTAWPFPSTRTDFELLLASCPEGHSWTGSPEPSHESLPIDCVSWYEAFAFCAWDGGRLPTEAEWMIAAGGGEQQRVFPWSSPPSSAAVDGSYAVFSSDAAHPRASMDSVGSRPAGIGRWGQFDLGGNAQEWLFDGVHLNDYVVPCTDCVMLPAVSGTRRVMGGSYLGQPEYMLSTSRGAYGASQRAAGQGFRCARDR